MAFEAELENISFLRDRISVISDLIDEAAINIKKDGIAITASDRAVVTVVDFMLSKDVFKNYSYEKDMRVGLNLTYLLQVLRRANPSDILKMRLEASALQLKLHGSSTRSFVIPLIDISREDLPPIDKLNFSSSFLVDTDILNSGIEDADIITDSVVFSINSEGVKMKAESDASSAELDMRPDGGLKNLKVDRPVRARYSLDYLKKIIKSRKLAEKASIEMDTDYPMRIRFDVPGKMQLGFILAPRVEE
ncbi:MAG: proliferating cell nuclear antigen (pcna) [Candidatus Aenigmarchaeota archaeon]|nr:proliferating cell nuclear antigen (pcna) [Candidatus Aenigmarchaeota archaeon]